MAANRARWKKPKRWLGRFWPCASTLGGSITGEHGVGMEKREYLPTMFSPVELEIMQDLRRAIDP